MPRTKHLTILHVKKTNFLVLLAPEYFCTLPQTPGCPDDNFPLRVSLVPKILCIIEEAEMLGGLEKAALLPSPHTCVRLPHLYIEKQEGGGEGGANLSLSSLSYASPTHTSETPSTYLPVIRRLPTRDGDSRTSPSGYVRIVWVPIAVTSSPNITGQSGTYSIPPHLVPCFGCISNSLPRSSTPLTPRPGPACLP